MATGQLQYILSRGRAYRCIPCGYIENKSWTEVHFYNQHVVDSDIPFVCVTCDYKTGDKKKLERHVESPAHLEKVESGLDGLEIITSASPRYIEVGKDIVKLSREDSARHWTRVSVMGEGKDQDIVEDLRPQLLSSEDMVLTPKRVVLEEVKKTLVNRSVQTDPMSLDQLEGKVDSLKGDMVNCMSSMFQYMEQLKELNGLQEGVIKKLEERLDRMKKDDDRDRRRREEHHDRRRDRSRSRERR